MQNVKIDDLPAFTEEKGKIEALRRLYTFKDSNEITTFLHKHDFLVPLLSEASSKIEPYFPNSELVLEMFTDPEGYGANQLVLFISTELNPKEARQKLKQLNSNWWVHAFERANGQLSINVEFR